LIIGIAVLALLIYRQVMPRPVRSASRLMLVLGVIGLVEAVQFFQHDHRAGPVVVAALAGSVVLAALFGVLRARTVKVWMKDGMPWSQGNWLTGLLWVIALAAHLGYDYLLDHSKDTAHLGDATIVLYLAVSLIVQRVIISQRASRLGQGADSAPFMGSGFGSKQA
jgi:peptidoglycan/LPS O-acetylase OafA/YrhL